MSNLTHDVGRLFSAIESYFVKSPQNQRPSMISLLRSTNRAMETGRSYSMSLRSPTRLYNISFNMQLNSWETLATTKVLATRSSSQDVL